MRDYLNIGCNPAEEPCVNVGEDNYMSRARAECRRFAELIQKKFGPPPGTAAIIIKSFPHDFGSYLEVCISYDDDDIEGVEYAYAVEAHAPQTWSDDAPVDWRAERKDTAHA